MKNARMPVWLFPAIIVAVGFIGNIAINLFTDDIKDKLQPYKYWIWGVLVLAFLIAVIGAIAEATSKSKQAGNPTDAYFTQIDIDDRKKLVDAFLRCACMSIKEKRDSIVMQLPPDIRNKIGRFPGNIDDVSGIIGAAMESHGGMWELMRVLEFFEGDTTNMRNLRVVVNEVVSGSEGQAKFDLPPVHPPVSRPKKIIRDSNASVLDKLTRSGESDRGD